MTTDRPRIPCGATVQRGPRAGMTCTNSATAVVVAPIERGMPVCGHHAREWLPWAIARIAYWNVREQAWL
jgi:hypothetical protein